MARKILYKNIDQDIRSLAKTLNESGIVKTYASCAGHGSDTAAEIIFKPVDISRWALLKEKLLQLSDQLPDANINIYEWHRIGGIDWVLEVQAHPRNRQSLEFEESEVREVLNGTFELIEKTIKRRKNL